MNAGFQHFVASGRSIALAKGLRWDPPHGPEGKINKVHRWNLTRLAGMVPPPTIWLSRLDYFALALLPLNAYRAKKDLSPVDNGAVPLNWQDLIKASVLNEIVVKKNKPGHAINSICRSLRLLAACADSLEPWEVDGECIQLAYNVALQMGESGKVASNLHMVVRDLLDGLHLSDRGPLARFCVPYPNENARTAQARVERNRRQANSYWSTDRLRTELQQRKSSHKLPEEKAFWELVRIVFTEKPKSFSDAIRFAQVKLGIVTGFRIGENAMLPLDWERRREYVDLQGRPAGERGGISRSLMIRYFAEKQSSDVGRHGAVLYETAQHVPPMFEEVVLETLGEVARITAPLRSNLSWQTRIGRSLPRFSLSALLPAWDLYTRISGNFWFLDEPPPEERIAAYRERYDRDVLGQLRRYQLARIGESKMSAVRKYWLRHAKDGRVVLRDRRGRPFAGRARWSEVHLRIDEVEELIRKDMPSKLSDTTPFNLENGALLYPYELLFLMPVRALAENRNGSIVDINRYFAVGRVGVGDLPLQLGAASENLFMRYGKTDEDKRLSLNTHALRHLLNTELFRLGVAETIITKHFGRRSVVQSHVYNHRSLGEDLAAIDLPESATEHLGPRAQEALKLIQTGRISGPIVEEFRRIQRELGDDAAFDYLDAEADGLHATPYGLCLNSFTVDPCPKHLECFNGCRHLSRTSLPDEQQRLEQLRGRFLRAVAKIEGVPAEGRTVGWQNQLEHAKTRLANIEKALVSAPGSVPFPDGPDLFRSVADKVGTTLLDGIRAGYADV